MKIKDFARAALALGFLVSTPVSAPGYPTKPVRIVVGFATGSVSDLAARMIGDKLASALGQPFVVGMLAPAGTPRAVVDALSREVNAALRSESVAQQMRLQGMELLGGSPEDFALQIKRDTAQWDAVLQGAGLGK